MVIARTDPPQRQRRRLRRRQRRVADDSRCDARIALAGNPNAGKTSLFNSLTGLRAKTGNFPGTTVEYRCGRTTLANRSVEIVDLPGMYSLKAATPEEIMASDILVGRSERFPSLDAVVVIADADNLERNLFLVSQIVEMGRPVVVALNMVDIAERHGIHIDTDSLSGELGCPVVPIVARTGLGVDKLRAAIEKTISEPVNAPSTQASAMRDACAKCGGCPYQSRFSVTEGIAARATHAPGHAKGRITEQIDRVMTHPTGGTLSFFGIMLMVFYLIFSVATVPMDMIDALFAGMGSLVARVIPPGDLQSLLVDGVIGGVGGILVFLPQICILFFFLALLEDSGYLARAAFVMDRLMRRIGLPGTAFVPLLSSHACAIPGIMASRVISDKRDRLLTILVAPLMTCSARIPVYAMITALLFPREPALAAIMFTGAYALGIVAALVMAFIFRRTILKGESKPLVLELPGYKIPRLRSVLLQTWDRAKIFVQQAGTIILVISIALWALATYPKSDPPPEALDMQREAAALAETGMTEEADALLDRADVVTSRHALSHSVAGTMGRLIEPVVRPLGFDWQIGIGIISSFAAREVIVSTLAIVYGMDDTAAEANPDGLYERLRRARRQDGSPVFTTATCVSLLIFYVLAMQCLPTQAVTRRETGTWKWPIFQLVYMSALAYVTALIAYQSLRALGIS